MINSTTNAALMNTRVFLSADRCKRLLSGITPLILLGCSAVPMSSGIAMAQSDPSETILGGVDKAAPQPPPRGSTPRGKPVGWAQDEAQDSQLMFELMIAELAGRRGQLDVAMAGYLRASSRTDDPRVAERATRLTLFGHQWDEAEKVAKRWLHLDPNALDAREMLAQALLQQGKSAGAAQIYSELISSSEDTSRTYRAIAGELQGLENPVQAVEVMQHIKQSFPGELEPLLGLARTQTAGGDNDAALQSIDEALVLDADNGQVLILKAQILMALGRPDEGLAGIEAALESKPKAAALRLSYARLLVQAGRFDGVTEQLDTLYENADSSAETLLAISALAIDARRFERAKTYLQSLQKTGQYLDQANFYLARISDQQQDYPAAITYYDAVQPGELQLSAQIRVAELLGKTGALDEGRQRLHQMAKNLPNQALHPQLLTAESRMLQSANQPSEAVTVLTGGLEQFPGNADLLYARALAADAAGDETMLVADLSAVIDVNPENAHALNALGYHLADNNLELERAETLLVKANSLLPNDPAILDSLGWLRYRQGSFDAAITLLKRAYSLYADTEIAAHLGEALWLSGQEDESRQLIEGALLDSPEDDKLLHVMKKYIQ